jgi:hypothetical protein
MKIKVVINGKSVEIEIPENSMGYVFGYKKDPAELLQIISKIIEEL